MGGSCLTRRAACVSAAAFWGSTCSGDRRDPKGAVARIVDARTVLLDTGQQVRLAGIETPREASGRAPAEPFAAQARSVLRELVQGKVLRFLPRLEFAKIDRWGRAHVLAALPGESEAGSVQMALIAAGVARVAPDPFSRGERAVDLLSAEVRARSEKRGLWSSPYYSIRSADAAHPSIGAFQIVEGVIVDASEVREWIYLNFGPDWRTDFTAAIPPEARPLFDAFEFDLLALPGASVRVRGFIGERNGPSIMVREPAAIERV